MMDFDDLEETAQERVDAGELSEEARKALGCAEGPNAYKGGYLWPIPHNAHFPTNDVLPEALQDSIEAGAKSRGALIRLFVFYGAGDSYPFWAQFVNDCPDWAEAAIYEWPRHGSREKDELPKHVDGLVADAMDGLKVAFKQHAKDGPLEGAPFALAGHSIGVLIMLGVAERTRALYGLEPSACFIMDRSAPQHPLCSDFGAKLLEEDAADFIRIFNPQVTAIYNKSKDQSPESKAYKMRQMWMDDIKFQNHTKQPGFHMFKCPLHVFAAMHNWAFDSEQVLAQMTEEQLFEQRERCSILGSDENSGALFSYRGYEDWKDWTCGGCHIHQWDVDHTNLKRDPKFWKFVWKTLDEFKATR